MNVTNISAVLLSSVIVCACSDTERGNENESEISINNSSAIITAVTTTGEPGNYSFLVTIESPDTGCNQYADWWEVLRTDGSLAYRRVLTHSHVNEQPFTRSGGPVNVAAVEDIYVRAHMNSIGYGERVFSGSVEQGLIPGTLESSFAEELEIADPLPDGCAF